VNIPHVDKLLHALVGFVFGVCVVVALGAALVKEWRDARPGGTGWSWGDVAATVYGAIAGAFVFGVIA
jgi:uncharacterized protein YfiM (DUF2279 family)